MTWSLLSDSRSLRHGGHTLVLATLACGSFGIAKACGATMPCILSGPVSDRSELAEWLWKDV